MAKVKPQLSMIRLYEEHVNSEGAIRAYNYCNVSERSVVTSGLVGIVGLTVHLHNQCQFGLSWE